MTRKLTILLLLSFTTYVSLAQDAATKVGDKVRAYVVLQNGSRLEGTIKIGDWIENETRVVFYAEESASKTVYSPDDLNEYGVEITDLNEQGELYQKWFRYHKKKVERAPALFASKTVMLLRESEGAFNLYCYYVSTPDNPKQPYKYNFYVEDEASQQLVRLEMEDYRGLLRDAFKDYPALQTRVGTKGFLFRDMVKMIDDYNYWVVNQHDANEYRVALKQ